MTHRYGLAALACLLALASGGCLGSGEDDPESSRMQTAPSPFGSSTFEPLTRPVPPLDGRATPFQVRRAEAIARQDETLRGILRGRRPTFAATGVWTSPTTGEALGVALDTRLPGATVVQAIRPYVVYADDDAPRCAGPYRKGWLDEDTRNARLVRVLVDLERRRKVVSIQTDGRFGTLSSIDNRLERECG